MNLLLDTHVLIWLDAEPEKLSGKATALLQDVNHQLFLSVVSVWEMQIKVQLGKLTLRADLIELLRDQQAENSLQILPVLLPQRFSSQAASTSS